MADETRSENEGPTLRRRAGDIADYIFGRNATIGLASLMLLVISGYATWSGMQDFIVGVSQTPGSSGRAIGQTGLSVTNDALVVAIVVALTFLMWIALRESFGANRSFRDRVIMLPLYVFLFLWSVGFGYGFWWSLIAGEEATKTSLAGLQEDARDAGQAIAARLDAVKVQIDSVATWSDGQMNREETSGGSCGVASGAGRGPLYNARKTVRDSITSLRDSVVNSWITPVQADLERLKQTAAQLGGTSVEERQRLFEARANQIRSTARSLAARSNELGASTANEMRAIANAISIEPGKPGFSCFDPTLAQRLRQAAEQAAQPAVLKLREAAFTEGPAGVANAVKNLWQNLGAYFGGLLLYVFSFGGVKGAWTSGGDPITGRDLIALLATVGVDLGLFALTALNPPKAPPKRFGEAEKRQIEDAINTAIARADGVDIEWVRRHFVHHHKASYLVIPNLFSTNPDDETETSRALAMNQLAGVLDDIGIVRWPTKRELKALRAEEEGQSMTDLTEVRRKRLAELESEQSKSRGIALDKDKADRIRTAEPIRNHGLFSKAERALHFAKWSEKATRDFEIFKLEDVEGLTPLLDALSRARIGQRQQASAPAAPTDGGKLRDVTPPEVASDGRPVIEHDPKA
ncbi:MAG: hypothetical protein R3D27_11465 [Hyphomicrobiaceae bacterium]